MLQGVPLGVHPRVAQPKIRGEIHDLEPGGQQLGGRVHGRAVGDRQKHQLAGLGQVLGVGRCKG